ncbi:MAG: hypothetical protein P4L51_07165 [Puia sp.]|nr:hypothetical protein [Puia sp.]
MVFLSFTLLTFVQFLWILLWVGISLVVLSVLAGGYLYYQNKKTAEGEEIVAAGGETATDPGSEQDGGSSIPGERAYQGLLWLKGKYEEDIQQADTKYFELREEFKKLEKRYIDLRVHSINQEQQLQVLREGASAGKSGKELQTSKEPSEVNGYLQGSNHARANHEQDNHEQGNHKQDSHEQDNHGQGDHLTGPPLIGQDQPSESHELTAADSDFAAAELLSVRKAEWENLNDKLVAETLKVKDLESRLASSSQLLMKMYKELASSLQASNTLYKNKAHENRVKGLVKEFDAVAAASGTEERKISSWVESPAVDEDGQFEPLQ